MSGNCYDKNYQFLKKIIIMKKFAILFLLLSSCASINKVSEVTINENFPHNEIQKITVIMFEVPDKEKDGLGSKKITVQDAGAILANVTAIELEKMGEICSCK